MILPLPLEGLFTYEVPDSLAQDVREGMRVVVPLGRSKTYIGIVAEVHDRKPDFTTRSIISLDSNPVLLPAQLELWRWIADY